jgi:hypothetical protein
MAEDAYVVVYWDTSAILSVLLKDNHTEEARKWVRKGLHLMSTLAYSRPVRDFSHAKKESSIMRL